MDARMEVTPSTGCYLVAAAGRSERLRPHRVSKEKACSCGGTAAHPCRHIRAVAEYLRAGGRRAAPVTEICTCPVCGAEVERGAPHLNRLTGRWIPVWRCPADPGHYWHWRGEQFGAKALMTQFHPCKAHYIIPRQEKEVSEMTPLRETTLARPQALQRPAAADRCRLCGTTIPADGPPLCAACALDEQERLADYRAEREQARRPL